MLLCTSSALYVHPLTLVLRSPFSDALAQWAWFLATAQFIVHCSVRLFLGTRTIYAKRDKLLTNCHPRCLHEFMKEIVTMTNNEGQKRLHLRASIYKLTKPRIHLKTQISAELIFCWELEARKTLRGRKTKMSKQ